jgi:hypothetical protein
MCEHGGCERAEAVRLAALCIENDCLVVQMLDEEALITRKRAGLLSPKHQSSPFPEGTES